MYSRPDVKEKLGLPRHAKGGNWDTGIVEHDGEFFIFANVGTTGRTGHDYGNNWEETRLRWYHKSGSHLGWASVDKLLHAPQVIHVFWRASNDQDFIYAGLATPATVADTRPVEIVWSFNEEKDLVSPLLVQNPDEVPAGTHREGATRRVLVNIYERDRAARQTCIRHYGTACMVCDLSFSDRYGLLGAGFIHVHHLIPLSQLGAEYELDAVKDLRPVCPNCHAMLHRRRPPLSISELRAMLSIKLPTVQ